MNKFATRAVPLIALAFGPVTAYAQSSITLYGIVDNGLVLQNGGPKGWGVNLSSGIQDVSRWGLRGQEDLGSGLVSFFKLEDGILANNGQTDKAGYAFSRVAVVGISTPYGTLTGGRDFTPIYNELARLTPFGNAFSGPGVLMANEKGGTYATNQLVYATPKLHGFSGLASYSLGGVPGSLADAQQFGFALSYRAGPADIEYAHYQINNADATDASRSDLLIARYDFGYVEGYLGYGVNHGPANLNSRDIHIGVSKRWHTRHQLFVAYEHKDDLDRHVFNTSALIVNYAYYLSTRTNLYAAAMMLSNTRFTTTKFGVGSREFDLGIRHLF